MIVVKCNKNEYAYDVHSLVKAFYPAEEVKVFEEGEKSLSSDAHLPELFIYFTEKNIEVTITENGEQKVKQDTVLNGNEDRAAYKNALKHLLYGILSVYTGKELPWGNFCTQHRRYTPLPFCHLYRRCG